ncbi:hypothetical protein T09_10788 [Trichinella sp. T9]|nr:hypothetical protein T09_10788 [Trichinella sp. T9]
MKIGGGVRVYSLFVVLLSQCHEESASQKRREIRRSIPARRQIAMDSPIPRWKKRTSLLEAAARYSRNHSRVTKCRG